MANEHSIFIRTSHAIPLTVGNTAGIEKGAVLQLIDPISASGAYSANMPVAGVAASEKIASDGKVKLGVYRGGVFRGVASGAITVGDALVTDAGVNHLKSAKTILPTTASYAYVVGTALETCTTGETFLYELNPIAVNAN